MKTCLIVFEELKQEKILRGKGIVPMAQKNTRDALLWKRYIERRLRESGIDLRREVKRQVFLRPDGKHDYVFSQDKDAPAVRQKETATPKTRMQLDFVKDGGVLK